jgi:methionyl-tRNA formyltransferase
MLNIHYSLLPQLRGPAPVQWALLRGYERTGVTLQHVAPELDSGDVVLQDSLEVTAQDNSATLFSRLEALGLPLLSTGLDLLAAGEAPRLPQDHSAATYAPLLTKQDPALSWADPASHLRRQVQAFAPRPGAYCHLGDSRCKILSARDLPGEEHPPAPGELSSVSAQGIDVHTGKGILRILSLQLAGGKCLEAAEFLRGCSLSPGDRFRDG